MFVTYVFLLMLLEAGGRRSDATETSPNTNRTLNVGVIADNKSFVSTIASEPSPTTALHSTTPEAAGSATTGAATTASPRTLTTVAPQVTTGASSTSTSPPPSPPLFSASSVSSNTSVAPLADKPSSSAIPSPTTPSVTLPDDGVTNHTRQQTITVSSHSVTTNAPTSGSTLPATTTTAESSQNATTSKRPLTHTDAVFTTSSATPPLTGSPVSRTTEAENDDITGSPPPPTIFGHRTSENPTTPEMASSVAPTAERPHSSFPATSSTGKETPTKTASGFVEVPPTRTSDESMSTIRSSVPPVTIDGSVTIDGRSFTTASSPVFHTRKKVVNAEMLGAPVRAPPSGGEPTRSQEAETEEEEVEGVSIDEALVLGGSSEEALSLDGGEESVMIGAGAGRDGVTTQSPSHLLYFDFRRQCQEEPAGEVWWNRTYGGVIAVRLCPDGYTGKVYRMCYYGGTWGDVDYSECRVQQLIKLKHLLYYHVHKNLTDGFHSLADELLNSLQRYRLRSVDDYLESLDSLNIIINARVTLDFDVGQDFKYLKTILKISDILFSKFDNKWSFPQEQKDMVTMKMVQILHGMTHFANLVAEGVKRSSRSVVVFTDYPHIGLEARVIRFDQDYRISLPDSGSSILLPAGLYKVVGSNDKYVVVTTWYNGISQCLHEDEGAVNSAIFATTIHPGHDTHFLSGPVTLTLSTTDKVEDDFYAECSYLRRTYNKSSLWSHVGCSMTEVHPGSVTCVCHHMANIAVIVRKQHHEGHVAWKPVSLIVIVGCAISLAALLSTFVAHVHVLRYDSSESSMILLNLLLAMTAAQIVFMGGIQATSSREVCEGVSIVLHYLYLVSSFWLLSHGIHVFLRTRSSKESPCSSHMRDYCLLSWVAPVVLVVVTFAVNPRGYEIKKYCWLSIEKGMLLSYIVPIFSLIMVNTTLMVMVLKHLFETQPFMKKSEIDKARTSVRAGVILLPFFGVNWFLGVLAMEDRSTEIFETIFAISTSLQGFLIFLFYSLLHAEVRKAFRQFTSRILRRRKSSDLRLRRNRRRQAALDAEPLLISSETLEQHQGCSSMSAASTSTGLVAQCLPRPEEPFVLAEEDQAIARADIT